MTGCMSRRGIRTTRFRDLREDLAEATANGQRLAIIIEQRGCIYCTTMHEEVYVEPDILEMLSEDFFFVRLNMHGSTEVTDFDGELMEEREIVRRWRNLFTPTILFFPTEVPEGITGAEGRGCHHARGIRNAGPRSTC